MTLSDLKLGFGLAWILMAAVFPPSMRADAPARPAAEKAPPAIFRSTLGAVFEASGRKNRDAFLKDCALELKQVVDALDECKFTVIKRLAVDARRGEVADLELVIEGKQAFVLKDADKKDISLKVTKVKLMLTSVIASKATTRYVFSISLAIEGKHAVKLLGVIEGEHTFTWAFMSRWYGYDAEGKPFDPRTSSPD